MEPTTLQSSVTYNNVTWSFYSDQACTASIQMQCGTTAEGYPFVVPDASLTRYMKTDVPSVQIAAASFTGGRINPNGSMTTGTFNTSFWANGVVENPWLFDGDYLGTGLPQGFDELLAYYDNTANALTASATPWDATKNVDPGYTGVGIPIAPGDNKSYVKGVRHASQTKPTNWRNFDRWTCINVFSTAVPLGAYSPGLSSTTKTFYATKATRNLAALGSGFTLPSGKPNQATVTSTGASGDYFRTLQPYFGQNGERRRRFITTDNSNVATGYSRDYGQLWNDYLAVILSAGSGAYDETMLNSALALGAQMISLYDRGGFISRGGAGQNCGHKQFVQLFGHMFKDVSGLMAKCLLVEGNVTHQQYWATSGYLDLLTHYPDGNHDIYMMPHGATDTNKAFFFLGNQSLPPDTAGVNVGTFDALTDTDYELTSGIAGFGEFNNISALRAGPSGQDGLQVGAQSASNYTYTNPYAAFIGYWDRYRQYQNIYTTSPYTTREANYYDARRTASTVAKWTGVPDRVQKDGAVSSAVLNPGNGQCTYDFTALGHNTETITGYDCWYSLDGISWKAFSSNSGSGTQTGLAVGKKHYVSVARQSVSGWGPYNVNFPHAVGDAERMTISLTGSSATAPSNTLAPALFRRTFSSWAGPDYTQLANGIGLGVDSVLYCGVGYWINNVTTFTYQWKRNGVNISGATNQSYTITSSDLGTTTTCTVTTNSVSATTAGIAIPGAIYPAFGLTAFDGTADYLTRASALSGGMADGKKVTFAVRLALTGGDGVTKVLARLYDAAGTSSTDVIFQVDRLSGNTIQVTCRAVGTTVFSCTSTTTLTTANGEVTLMVSLDLAAAAYHFYIDNSAMTMGSITGSLADINLAGVVRASLLGSISGTGLMPANFRYLFFHNDYIDLSNSTNRDKFLTANIGNQGEGVFGTPARIMVYGDATSLNAGNNYGTGGNFTMTGAVTNVPTFGLTAFDGTADYLTRASALSGGMADGKKVTFAVRLALTGGDGVTKVLARLYDAAGTSSTDVIFQVDRLSGNTIQVRCAAAGTTVFSRTSTTTLTTANGEVTLMISLDLAVAAYHFYIDGSAMTMGSVTGTLADINLAGIVRSAMLGTITGTALVPANFRYLFFHNDYIDLSNSTNRDKFLTANIGNQGEGVFGTPARIMIYGDAASLNAGNNYGSGGNFVMNGAVTDV